MRFWQFKRFLAAFAAALVGIGAFVGARCFSVCRLSAIEGARTFYLHSPSSQALCKTTLSIFDIFSLQGECVRFEWKKQGFGQTDSLKAIAEEIAAFYGAEILFFENAGGSLSVYCYSPRLVGGIDVDGEWVNLHIALRGNTCAVGTPLIFDGF